jgi:hypothetical protein
MIVRSPKCYVPGGTAECPVCMRSTSRRPHNTVGHITWTVSWPASFLPFRGGLLAIVMSSAAVPVEIIPGSSRKPFRDRTKNRSPSRRNHCSPSARNPVRLHPGTLFAITPEFHSPCPGNRTQLQFVRVRARSKVQIGLGWELYRIAW